MGMRKRTFHRVLIILVLLTLTGCASIQMRVSDCQQTFANTFSSGNRIPRHERQVLMTLDDMAAGKLASTSTGSWPCKRVANPCQWRRMTCSSGHMTGLVLGYQDLNGEIPPELGNLAQLQALVLVDLRLSGEIPVELENLSQLEKLALSYNQLSGPIPSELGNLSNLTELYLNNNQLTGELPTELGNLSKLKKLLLSENQLSGPLPEGLTDLPVSVLFLSNTDLCVPRTPEFETWLEGIKDRDFEEVPYCE